MSLIVISINALLAIKFSHLPFTYKPNFEQL